MVAPKLKGEVSEYNTIAKLLEEGYKVYDGCTENDKVDLVVEKDNGLKKVQVKTVRHEGDKLAMSVSSSIVNMSETRRESYSENDIDFFIGFCPKNSKFYKIPVEETGKSKITLRLEETKNNQSQGIRWAEDYEI
jgi:hypothetical protein